jgi:hypothetical protein
MAVPESALLQRMEKLMALLRIAMGSLPEARGSCLNAVRLTLTAKERLIRSGTVDTNKGSLLLTNNGGSQ